MGSFFAENGGTLLISLLLLVILGLVVRSMLRNKKQGKSSCGCGCSHCASSGVCHSKGQRVKEQKTKV